MKANRASLVVYFTACIFTVVFTLVGQNTAVLYAKSLVVPSVFVYYFIINKYKIDYLKGFIFIFAFTGDVIVLLNEHYSEMISVISFLVVYVLLLTYIVKNFEKTEFSEKIIFLTIAIIATIVYLAISILSLELEKMQTDFSVIIIYTLVLILIISISVINYIIKNNYTSWSLLFMATCLMFSDIFYVINGFFLSLTVFSAIEMGTQVISYFFMVNYFIGTDTIVNNEN
jgi:hypothetical protein